MTDPERRAIYVQILQGLLGLFTFRVAAQLLQSIHPVGFLPGFDQWQSGALPYPILVFSQLIIIGICILLIRGIRTGSTSPKSGTGIIWLVIGGVYFAVMFIRLILGATISDGHEWWDAPIPAFFHLILAGFLLVLGFFHLGQARITIAWACYPAIMVLVLVLHTVLTSNNLSITIATLVPVLLGAVFISLLEHYFPNRKAWRANSYHILNDVVFMLVVQNLLPKLLGFLLTISLLEFIQSNSLSITENWRHYWPHDWPIFSQVIAMMVIAEFFRYWIHRLAHNWTPLWQLHAVHHSPHNLYWINVGRFHPLEKSLQYVFDALPFILLGVSPAVLAMYFVFYAVNGFFQHCNIVMRLGLLNYLISGPELHRWHHSVKIEESNNNYGNNLIVWDLIFGTWYLPKSRQVDKLGLVNRNYPSSFLAQMKAPFIKGLDKLGMDKAGMDKMNMESMEKEK